LTTIDSHVSRVEVQPEHLIIRFAQVQDTNRQQAHVDRVLEVRWHTPSKRAP
jgi:hypothetical protein